MALIGEMHYLTIGGNTYSIPVSGGSTVTIERALTSGTKSATISVDGTSYDLYAPTPNAGTVTSVRVQATSPVQSSTSTAQSSTLNTTISLANGYGDTKNPYVSKTKNYVLAAPTTENGVPSFRALVAADIPDLSDTYATQTDLENLPEPMIFKGSLGTGGTITSLPTAAASNEGYTYKVITAGTYASQSAKVGDTFISDGSAWVLIPSGDEPSGTVTSVTLTQGTGITVSNSGTAITTSGSRTISLASITKDDTTSTASPSHGGTFTAIDSITYDTYGRVTGVNTKTVTLPADSNTDTKVTQAYSTTNSNYPVLFSATAGVSSTSSRGATTAILNNAIYANPSTGNLHVTQLNGVTVGTSPKFTDTTYTNVSEFTNDAGYVTSSGVTSITLKAGSGISLDTDDTAITTTGTRTISHADTSSQASSSNSGRTYIQSITLDTYGHVTGISTATESVTNTDTKLQVAAITSGTTYYPIVGTGTTAATRQYDTTGFSYQGTNGTTSAIGCGKITLGNSTASGTANNKQGQLVMYGSTAYAHTIKGAPTKARTLTLPDADGTVALTSQIPTVPSSTESATTGITIAAHGTTSIGSASNWSAGTASTWAFEEVSIPNVTAAGSASTWAFEEKTIPNVTSAGTASSWTFEEKTIPNVTAAGSGSFTATVTNHVLSFSHTHTAPTIGTAIKVQSKSGGSNGTAPTLGTAIKVQSKKSGSNGTAPTIGTAIKVQSKKSGANSTVPSLTITSTTVTTGTTHSITDPGHTHTL